MKKIILLLILLMAFGAQAQKARGKGKQIQAAAFEKIDAAQVPEAVKNSFNAGFQNVTDVRWEKHSATGKGGKTFTKYVAVYNQEGIRSRARFKEDGTALSSSKYMGAQKLPDNVKNAAASKNPGFTVMGGEEVKTKKGETYYRVRMRKGTSRLSTLFDANGNEVTKDKVPDEAKEDEGDEGN